ncbi:hypothetical protein L1987_45472 [Smallanthus sonchifolius]|uniref:Uncharacterized protein n=1 Tax=Smallanthus sonchifolius TaxID=185202 RepID=A0ACB9FY50_9ASTR|nr:hypothetical protein L1987_45472 [Smallanthus sonchifolius]
MAVSAERENFIYVAEQAERYDEMVDAMKKVANLDIELTVEERNLLSGTTYVYDSFFRPYISKHETDIDRNLMEIRTRAGDMFVLYWQKAASYSQTRIFDVLQYIALHQALELNNLRLVSVSLYGGGQTSSRRSRTVGSRLVR